MQIGRWIVNKGQKRPMNKALYAGEGVDGAKPVIAYCRIGERSARSHRQRLVQILLQVLQLFDADREPDKRV
jgi:3-mercaptopyruvate sulfurtransferase SseA